MFYGNALELRNFHYSNYFLSGNAADNTLILDLKRSSTATKIMFGL